jgi:uncharacterized protein (UPF0335 family)
MAKSKKGEVIKISDFEVDTIMLYDDLKNDGYDDNDIKKILRSRNVS